jgi:DNA-binding NarL/FixJ family response regulator
MSHIPYWCVMVSRSSSSRLRFVVVDDKEEVRHLVGTLLQLRHGWELVGEASDGMAAVELVNELKPDIVIMDIEMPRLNGIEATKQITSHVPQSIVIGFSTYTDAETRNAMKEAGSAAFVSKDEVLNLPHVIEQLVQAPHLT